MTQPRRIVSLLPSATEILFAIGAGDRVVAITHECDYPTEAQHLPRVTANALPNEGQPAAVIDRHIRKARHEGSSIYLLDEAKLAALQPDLIVTQELCDVCAVNYAVVEQAVRRLPGDVPVISLEPASLDDIVATVLVLGRATGCERGAEQVAASMRERFAVVQSLSAPSPPSMACIEWTDPIMAGGHWVPEMVALAGGRDALGKAGLPSHDVDWDEVTAAAPDVMVLMPCGFGLERTLQASRDITGRPGFDELPCARSGRAVAVDGSSYFNRPGPRIATGLEILAAAMRAEPGDRLPAGAEWVPVTSPSPVATAR
jgi:iron complex transport system substrate-binding protein